MNGIHDLDGMYGLGPILNEENEPYFHHEQKRRIFPLFALLFVGGHFSVDEFRYAIERMDPAHYLEASYYEHWLHAFEALPLEKGVITADELWGGSTPVPCAPGIPVLTQDIVTMVVNTGASTRISRDIAPRLKVGNRVRIKNINPITHTRLPRYVRGEVSRTETNHGVFIAPNTAIHGLDEHPQRIYSVSFAALELWGTPRSDNVYIDLWDNYLEKV